VGNLLLLFFWCLSLLLVLRSAKILPDLGLEWYGDQVSVEGAKSVVKVVLRFEEALRRLGLKRDLQTKSASTARFIADSRPLISQLQPYFQFIIDTTHRCSESDYVLQSTSAAQFDGVIVFTSDGKAFSDGYRYSSQSSMHDTTAAVSGLLPGLS
jgi:hypothetical protein